MSDISVVDRDGNVVAEGWVDFVHGGEGLPLHVFWLFLDLRHEHGLMRVKPDIGIPEHVWARMSEASKEACAAEGCYDSNWKRDAKVQQWKRDRGLTQR